MTLVASHALTGCQIWNASRAATAGTRMGSDSASRTRDRRVSLSRFILGDIRFGCLPVTTRNFQFLTEVSDFSMDCNAVYKTYPAIAKERCDHSRVIMVQCFCVATLRSTSSGLTATGFVTTSSSGRSLCESL